MKPRMTTASPSDTSNEDLQADDIFREPNDYYKQPRKYSFEHFRLGEGIQGVTQKIAQRQKVRDKTVGDRFYLTAQDSAYTRENVIRVRLVGESPLWVCCVGSWSRVVGTMFFLLRLRPRNILYNISRSAIVRR